MQHLKFAYGPALICVGLLMLNSMRQIDTDDITEAFPAFATIAMMIFTYSIANGLTAGLVLYVVIKVLSGKIAEVNSGAWLLAGACLLYFIYGLPH